MTLDTWLDQATGAFPRGVRERLAQEYRSHLEDSVVAGGTADACEAFGNPRKIKAALKKLYIEEKQLSALKKHPKWTFWLFLGITLEPPVLDLISRPSHLYALPVILITVTFFFLWHLTRSWAWERKYVFRHQIAISIYFISKVPDQVSGNFVSSFSRIAAFVGFVSALILIVSSLPQDRRIRRTLEIEDVSLEERRTKIYGNT